MAFWNGNFYNSLLIKFLVNDHWTHGLISAFAILSKKLRCIGSAGLSLFVMLVAITVVLRLKIYCNLETVPSTGLFPEEKNRTLWVDSSKSHIQVVAYRRLNQMDIQFVTFYTIRNLLVQCYYF